MQDRLAEKSSEVAPARVLTHRRPQKTTRTNTNGTGYSGSYLRAGVRQAKGRRKSEGEPQLADMEEHLGENWLNKIGTTAFVIGVALL